MESLLVTRAEQARRYALRRQDRFLLQKRGTFYFFRVLRLSARSS